MSSLERNFLKAKLGKLPLQPPDLGLQEDDDDAEEELDQVAELGGGTSVAGSACVSLDREPVSPSLRMIYQSI